jgi:hypothetical protein
MSASEQKPPEPAPKDGAKPKEVQVPDLSGRADQLGAIIVKTLDLAEAGLSLGITVLTRAGAVAQEALADRPPAPNASTADNTHSHNGTEEQPTPVEDETFFLTNRVPLAAGGTAQVSFSITNDSLVEPKRVSLRIDALVGEHEGVRIDSSVFAVRPARKTIAPMDFEKFVLTGTLPAAIPADVYRGVVIVSASDEMSIPVALFVTVP